MQSVNEILSELENADENNKDFEWVAEYLIREIKGSIAA